MTMTRGSNSKSKDTAKAQELTEYEKKRLSNMAKIERRFQSLGIARIKNIMEATTTSNTTEKAREPNRKNNDDSDYDPEEDRGAEEDETTTMSTPTKAQMEAMMEPDADGNASSATEVVSKVLNSSCATSKFLGNVGFKSTSTKNKKTSREELLEKQLEEESQDLAKLQEIVDNQQKELDDLKKNTAVSTEALIKTQKEVEEFRKRQEETEACIRLIMRRG